jgi:hypothetical protein
MSTMAMTYNQRRFSFPAWIIAFAAVAAGLILGVHAAKHALADTVRNCPDSNIALKLVNPITGRMAIVCEYEPDQYGRIITEGDHEVTAYASEKRSAMNTLDHVIGALTRGGYTRIAYIKPGLSDLIARILAAMP